MQILERGLSVLIPVYNYSVERLVRQLITQGTSLNIPFEVLVFDDASLPEFKIRNQILQEVQYVQYKELADNVGRSKIRNLLAVASRYSNLLFLDCDSQIVKKDFLENYWAVCDHPVVVGGRVYTNSKPLDPEFLLHWTIGKAREENAAADRQKSPYKSFMFNNLFIQKVIYEAILLDEAIRTYGHEDTKFGNDLERRNIPVLHLDNPMLHEGLDSREDFMHKTKLGIENLYRIAVKGYGSETRIFKTFQLMKVLRLSRIFLWIYNWLLKKKVERNLRSLHPSLFCFDLYKLAELTSINP